PGGRLGARPPPGARKGRLHGARELGPITYQVSCGVHAFVVFCNSVECYEVDTELTRRWQKALRSRHGCRLIRRLGYPSSKCFAGIIAWRWSALPSIALRSAQLASDMVVPYIMRQRPHRCLSRGP